MEHGTIIAILLLFLTSIKCAPQSYHKVSQQKHETKTEEVYSSHGGSPPPITHSSYMSPQRNDEFSQYNMHSATNRGLQSQLESQQDMMQTYDSLSTQYNNYHNQHLQPQSSGYSTFYSSYEPRSLHSSNVHSTESFLDNEGFNKHRKSSYSEINKQSGTSDRSSTYSTGGKLIKLIDTAPQNNMGHSVSTNEEIMLDRSQYTSSQSRMTNPVHRMPDDYWAESRKSGFNSDKLTTGSLTDSNLNVSPQTVSNMYGQENLQFDTRMAGTNNQQYGYIKSTKEESYKNSNGEGWTKKEHEFQPITGDLEKDRLLRQHNIVKTIQTPAKNKELQTESLIENESRTFFNTKDDSLIDHNSNQNHNISPVEVLRTYDSKKISPNGSSWSSWSAWSSSSSWSTEPQRNTQDVKVNTITNKKRIGSELLNTHSAINEPPRIRAVPYEATGPSSYQFNAETQEKTIESQRTGHNITPLPIRYGSEHNTDRSLNQWVSEPESYQYIHPVITSKKIESASLKKDEAFVEHQRPYEADVFGTAIHNTFETEKKEHFAENPSQIFDTSKTLPNTRPLDDKTIVHSNEYKTTSFSSSDRKLGFTKPADEIALDTNKERKNTNFASLIEQEKYLRNTNTKNGYVEPEVPKLYIGLKEIPQNSDYGGNKYDESHQKSENYFKSSNIVQKTTEERVHPPTPIYNMKITEEERRPSEITDLLNNDDKHSTVSIKKETHNSSSVVESKLNSYRKETSKNSETTVHQRSNNAFQYPESKNYKIHDVDFTQPQFGQEKNLELIEQTHLNPVYNEGAFIRTKYNQFQKEGDSVIGQPIETGLNREITDSERRKLYIQSDDRLPSKKITTHESNTYSKQTLREFNHMSDDIKGTHETQQNLRGIDQTPSKSSNILFSQRLSEESKATYGKPQIYPPMQSYTMFQTQETEPCPYEGTTDELNTGNRDDNSWGQRALPSSYPIQYQRNKRNTGCKINSSKTNKPQYTEEEYKRVLEQLEKVMGTVIETNKTISDPEKSDENVHTETETKQFTNNNYFDEKKDDIDENNFTIKQKDIEDPISAKHVYVSGTEFEQQTLPVEFPEKQNNYQNPQNKFDDSDNEFTQQYIESNVYSPEDSAERNNYNSRVSNSPNQVVSDIEQQIINTDINDSQSDLFNKVNNETYENSPKNQNTTEEQFQQTYSNGVSPSTYNQPQTKPIYPTYDTNEYKNIIKKFQNMFDFGNVEEKEEPENDHTMKENSKTNFVKEEKYTNHSNTDNGSKEINSSENNSLESHELINNDKQTTQLQGNSSLWDNFQNQFSNVYNSAKDKVKNVAVKVRDTMN